MKPLITISRFITGLVFIFSGAVKAIDPLGSAYKFGDYFQAFNLGFLQFSALPLAVVLCTIEFLAGFSLITGYRIRTGIWAVMIMMLIFTPLTFVLALTNPVSDCGCFGDAIHLTNWQTFFKNIVLLVFALVLLKYRKEIRIKYRAITEWLIISGMGVIMIGFAWFNLRYLPVLDFLPYTTGTYIPDKMVVPEGKPVDKYETTFIYEKDGVKKEFTLDNYPADDTTWVFVDQKSVLVQKGYQPPINQLNIISVNNDDLTDQILSDEMYSLLMISPKLEEAGVDKLRKGFELGFHCMEQGIPFYILSASGSNYLKTFDNGLLFCSVDDITLKTMVRSNPGYILLKNGTIVGKWSWRTLPDNNWFTGNMERKQMEMMNNRTGVFTVIILILALALGILLLQLLLRKESNN
jgi:uncharacterized membrane protein YphA (DoxX/SURF4 family)